MQIKCEACFEGHSVFCMVSLTHVNTCIFLIDWKYKCQFHLFAKNRYKSNWASENDQKYYGIHYGIHYWTLVVKLWEKYPSKTLNIWLLLSLEPNCVTGLEWSIFLILFYILVTRFARQLLQSEFELEMCEMQNDLQPIRHNWGVLMLPFLILT